MMAVWRRAGSAGGEDGGQDRVDSTRQGRAMAIGVLAHLAPMPTYNQILPSVRACAKGSILSGYFPDLLQPRSPCLTQPRVPSGYWDAA